MPRRYLSIGLLAVGFAAAATGCEVLDRRSKASAEADPADPIAPAEAQVPEDRDETPKSTGISRFYKASKRPGGLSDEAREIEGHFNIQ